MDGNLNLKPGINSLTDSCVLMILKNLSDNEDNLEILPANIKDRLLNLMSKRGCITDTNIEKVLHNRVRELDLSESDVSDTALTVISRYGAMLRKVDLNAAKVDRINITSSGVRSLAQGCPYLQVVYLRRCVALTDDAVVALAQHCRHLRDLNIGGCPLLTDASLHALGEHSCFLRCLNFSKAAITDGGVFSLVGGQCAQTLKEVHMAGCREVTDEAVEAVVQMCPNITILIFHSCPKLTERSRLALEELQSGPNKMKQVTWTIY